MLDAEAQSKFHIMFPIIKRLPWKSIDEVEADVREPSFFASLHSINCLLTVVAAPKKTQEFVVERLCPHADAIDGCSGKIPQPFGRNVVGIGFDGYLRIGFYREKSVDFIEEFVKQMCGQEAGSPAP